MSHDTDKLIRQLSLVAFLMAERRPLTARDVKQNVEGYQEMSDEAFARRFYSDRAELLALGRPARLPARRVHRRGALPPELGALLPAAARADRRGARGAPDLPLPARGPVRLRGAAPPRAPEPRARPAGLRRRADRDRARRRAPRSRATRPSFPGRLAKLEGAISKSRTLKFEYWSIMRDEQRERTVNPYALLFDRGQWYVVGLDLDDERVKTFRVSRIRGDIRLATRRERDFRLPEDFDAEEYRQGPPWQVGETKGEARIEVARRHGLVGRPAVTGATAGSRTASSSRTTRTSGSSRPGSCARTGARFRSRRPSSGGQVRADLDLVHKRHAGQPPQDRGRGRRGGGRRARSARRARCRPSASACCRRSSPTCSTAAATTRRP